MNTKEIYEKAKNLAIELAPEWKNHLRYIAIEENGDIAVCFERYYSSDTDYHSETFTMEDLLAEPEITISKFKKIYEDARIAQEEAKKQAKVKEEKEKEEREKGMLKKLQEKYGNI